MTNKEASYKQEHMVADFMGWSVVTGSGSRPFTPGDISSDHFLVECKTHTKDIYIYFFFFSLVREASLWSLLARGCEVEYIFLQCRYNN